MKLVVCIVDCRDKKKVSEELIREGHKFTALSSTGGFLGEHNATLLMGVEDQMVETVLEVVKASCQSRDQVVNVSAFEAGNPGGFIPSAVSVPVGGAVVFVLDVDKFIRF